jgi:hypothetical protein
MSDSSSVMSRKNMLQEESEILDESIKELELIYNNLTAEFNARFSELHPSTVQLMALSKKKDLSADSNYEMDCIHRELSLQIMEIESKYGIPPAADDDEVMTGFEKLLQLQLEDPSVLQPETAYSSINRALLRAKLLENIAEEELFSPYEAFEKIIQYEKSKLQNCMDSKIAHRRYYRDFCYFE